MTFGPACSAAAAGLLVAAGAAAQDCPPAGPGLEVAATAAAVRYAVGGGADGIEVGARVGWRTAPFVVSLGVARVLLEGGGTDPVLVRASAARPLVSRGRAALCGAALGGFSWLSSSDDRALTLAGGAEAVAGMRLPVRRATATPYAAFRVLAARTTGELLELEIAEAGVAVGGEAGAVLELGRVVIRASASFDGLDPGLGATPYPARAFRAGIGWRF